MYVAKYVGQSSTAHTISSRTAPAVSAVHGGGVHGDATSSRSATAPANTPSASSRAGPQTKQRLKTPSDDPR
jgi:hypothetical protein